MSPTRHPTPKQIRRRRAMALIVFGLFATAAVYLTLAATLFAPADQHGARVVHMDVHSQAVGRELGVNGADLSSHSWHGGHVSSYWNAHWPAYLRFYASALASC